MVVGVRAGKGTVTLLRIGGCVLLLAMAVIHGYLWLTGYDSIPVIGLLFLLNAIGGVVLAVGVVALPFRLLGLASALSALFTAGTLGALLVSMTVGLFGFVESPDSVTVISTIVVEAIGVVVLAALAAVSFRRR
jgi:hypothetical protein